MGRIVNLLFLLCLCASSFLNAQTQNWMWANGINDTGNNYAQDVAVDSQGNSYVFGDFKGTLTLGSFTATANNTYPDCYIAKYDSDGNCIWLETITGTYNDNSACIVIDNNDNIYLTGRFDGSTTTSFGDITRSASGGYEIYVAKLDCNGNWQWVANSTGSGWEYDMGMAIDVDDSGNTYVTGQYCNTSYFGSHTLTGYSSWNSFIAKVDANGNWAWVNKITTGSSGYRAYGTAIHVNSENDAIVVGGVFESTAIFEGYTTLSASADWNLYVATLSTSNGSFTRAEVFGNEGNNHLYSIDLDENNDIFIAGQYSEYIEIGNTDLTSNGGRDAFIAKLTGNSNYDGWWALSEGGNGDDRFTSLQFNSEGDIITSGNFEQSVIFDCITGTTTINSLGSLDLMIAEYSPTGINKWVKSAGGAEDDANYGLTLFEDDLSNYAYTFSNFSTSTNYGNFTVTSIGGVDGCLAKFEYFTVKSDFTVNDTSAYIGQPLQFTDNSIGEPTIWEWDFDDNGIIDSYEQNPVFEYDTIGTFDVKLTVRKGDKSSIKIYEEMIDVFYAPPADVQNLTVDLVDGNAELNWDAVTTTMYDDPLTVDGYIINYNERNSSLDEDFYYLWFTENTSFQHYRVAVNSQYMFYRIIAVKYYNRAQLRCLKDLNKSDKKIKWSEVKWKIDNFQR